LASLESQEECKHQQAHFKHQQRHNDTGVCCKTVVPITQPNNWLEQTGLVGCVTDTDCSILAEKQRDGTTNEDKHYHRHPEFEIDFDRMQDRVLRATSKILVKRKVWWQFMHPHAVANQCNQSANQSVNQPLC
jgi:hypothetical protein